MTREQLTKLHSMMDSTNGDLKTNAFKGIVFKDPLQHLAAREKDINGARELMFEITNIVLTREFADESGKIQWRTLMKAAIDLAKSAIDMNAGARAAVAAAAAAAAAGAMVLEP